MKVWEIGGIHIHVRVCVSGKTTEGNHSHSFRSITFSVSQSVRPLTDTLGFGFLKHSERRWPWFVFPRTEVNINQTNQSKPIMTPQPPNIICTPHFGWRSVFSADTVHLRVIVAETNCFQLNPILGCYNDFLTAGKVPDLCPRSAQMRRSLTSFCKREKKSLLIFHYVSFYTKLRFPLCLHCWVLNGQLFCTSGRKNTPCFQGQWPCTA